MEFNFKVILEPPKSDIATWGLLAHVNEAARLKIKTATAGEFKKYINYIESQLKYQRKKR